MYARAKIRGRPLGAVNFELRYTRAAIPASYDAESDLRGNYTPSNIAAWYEVGNVVGRRTSDEVGVEEVDFWVWRDTRQHVSSLYNTWIGETRLARRDLFSGSSFAGPRGSIATI